MKKPNWLTTVWGVLAAAGAAMAHYTTGGIAEIGTIVSIACTALLGASAQDAGNSGK